MTPVSDAFTVLYWPVMIYNFAIVVDTGKDTGDAPSKLREFAIVFKGTISKKTIYQ
jgi:hypothetical protein